jgi:inner membrane protein
LDNVTHGLLGAALGMARRREGGPEHDAPLTATDKAIPWATFAAAELPDSDVFFGKGPMAGLVYHRGITHALLVAPLAALVAALAAKLLFRKARFTTLYAWSLVSLLVTHLFTDWMTGWGTRLLLPFSNARLGLDWVPIVDWPVLLALAVAVVKAWRRPDLRRKLSVGVLAGVAVFWLGYRGIAHTVVDRMVAASYTKQSVVKYQVSPDLFNPFLWRFTVDLGDRYEQGAGYVWGLNGASQSTGQAAGDFVTEAVRNAPEVKPFFDHFHYPLVTYRKVAAGYEVSLVDVRYRTAGRGMQYIVLLTPDLQVANVGQGAF